MVEKIDRKREPKRNVTASSSQCVPNFRFLAGSFADKIPQAEKYTR